MESGLIFNIQKYSLHDGPGIRTSVFLKGCPLRCLWCHNPESQSSEREISIHEERCGRCGACWEACPNQRPALEPPIPGTRDACGDAAVGRGPLVDRLRCIRCGQCIETCLRDARQWVGRWMTVAEVIEQVLLDRVFYDESAGGVTFSGGEPLAQAPFLVRLLAACRREGIHTAVDTCGYASREALLSVVELTDLFLYDVKIVDDARHRIYTGVSNAGILENLRVLSRCHRNIWIRIPIVAGFNDLPGDLEQTADLLASLPGLRRISLLPYHELGMHKSQRLGKVEPFADLAPPSADALIMAASRFQHLGVPVQIGA